MFPNFKQQSQCPIVMLKCFPESFLTLGTCGAVRRRFWGGGHRCNSMQQPSKTETRMSPHCCMYMSKWRGQWSRSTYRWGSCTVSLACQMEAVCFCPGPQLGLAESRWGGSPYSTNETKRNIIITQNMTADQHENISDPTERGRESLCPLFT